MLRPKHTLVSTMLTKLRLSSPTTASATRNMRRTLNISQRASSSSALPLDPVSTDEEARIFQERCANVQEFFNQPRFAGTKRPYTASDVVAKQGSFPPATLTGSLLADKLFALFTRAAERKEPVHTMGAIDPVQVTQMARYQEVVYVSGWAASSVLTTANNEVGPDLSYVPFSQRHLVIFDHLRTAITHIRPFPIKYIAFSVRSNCMTENTMMSECLRLQRPVRRWSK